MAPVSAPTTGGEGDEPGGGEDEAGGEEDEPGDEEDEEQAANASSKRARRDTGLLRSNLKYCCFIKCLPASFYY
jgi:TATA-binding protein-associated factor Taf7